MDVKGMYLTSNAPRPGATPCRACGAAVEADLDFCEECGERMRPAPAPPREPIPAEPVAAHDATGPIEPADPVVPAASARPEEPGKPTANQRPPASMPLAPVEASGTRFPSRLVLGLAACALLLVGLLAGAFLFAPAPTPAVQDPVTGTTAAGRPAPEARDTAVPAQLATSQSGEAPLADPRLTSPPTPPAPTSRTTATSRPGNTTVSPVTSPNGSFETTGVDVPPRVVSQVPPEYPPGAMRRRVEDTVVLRLLISRRGTLTDVEFLRRSQKDRAFNTAAVNAVRQWTFAPARKDGRPVSCWLNVAVPFARKR